MPTLPTLCDCEKHSSVAARVASGGNACMVRLVQLKSVYSFRASTLTFGVNTFKIVLNLFGVRKFVTAQIRRQNIWFTKSNKVYFYFEFTNIEQF